MNHTEALQENSHHLVQKLWLSIFPIQVLIASVGAINGLIDGAVASRFLGADAVAAVGLFTPLLNINDGFIMALSVGGIMSITRFIGRVDRKNASAVFTRICLMLATWGLGFGLLLFFACVPLSSLLQGDELLQQYMMGYSLLLVVRALSGILTDTLQVLGSGRRSMVGVIVMASTNVVGDFVLVAILHMGLFGLGLATGISYLAQFLVILPPYLRKNCPLRFHIAPIPAGEFRNIFLAGIPGYLGYLTGSIKALGQNAVLMAVGGTMALAAASVQATIMSLLASVTGGAGQAALILLSLYFSEEDRRSMVNVLYITLRNSLIVGVGVMALVMGFSEQIAALYFIDEPEAMAYTIAAFRIIPIYLPINILYYVILRAWLSEKKNMLTNVMACLEQMFLLLFSASLGMLFGVNGVWFGIPVGTMAILLTELIYVWFRKKYFTLKLEDILLMPDTLGVPEEDRIDRTVYSATNATDLSKSAYDFCRDHNLTQRQMMAVSLSIEEICVLLFRYAPEKNRKFQVDMRVFLKDGYMTIRFRDNGSPLFTGEDLKFENAQDPTAGVGIRILLSLTDTHIANSVMGMNVITIRVKV